MKNISAIAQLIIDVHVPVIILFFALFSTAAGSEQFLVHSFLGYLAIVSAVLCYVLWIGILQQSTIARHTYTSAGIVLVLSVLVSLFLIQNVFFSNSTNVEVWVLFYLFASTLVTFMTQGFYDLQSRQKVVLVTVVVIGMCAASIAFFTPLIGQSYSFFLIKLFLMTVTVPVIAIDVVAFLKKLSLVSGTTYNKVEHLLLTSLLGIGLIVFTLSVLSSEFLKLIQ